ncbi:MAG: MaoC family dehydratase N-terminal domain-containing protein [Rhodospirillales bacterium]|nr:MaoC family dehydratase N-terminal domain-containing protein [Rhodospirillales bacterium]MDP6804009.1 MaoC family dehydratase N-terminal domain-containing protein [Rhodospirillales bacterium]
MNETLETDPAIDAEIDAWAERTRELTGKEVRERETWNHDVTADTIRHFAYGTDDDNPLWTDAEHAAHSRYGRLVAPPAYLVSVLYPMLHGAPMKAPLASLIGGVKYEWRRPIFAGDRLRAVSKQGDFFEKRNKQGRRLNFVISEITYLDAQDAVVGVAAGTMIMATQVGHAVMFERNPHRCTDAELVEIERAFLAETRRGAETLHFEDVGVGDALAPIVRGPLTIGDMVAWNAGIGPSYKAGRWGFLDLQKAPHAASLIPPLNFPVKYSQQHEDSNIAAGRGMPSPFDNGVMRFAWVAPLVTNWMGDDGALRSLEVQVRAPGLYGDIVTYAATVAGKDEKTGVVSLDITGTNQEGGVPTVGKAEVELPRK